MARSYSRILRNRNFFYLWFGQIVSQFGDRLTQMALLGLVYKIMPQSTMTLAKVMSLAIVPVFLVSPVAGVYIDRWDKRRTMYAADLLRGICIFLIPLFFFKFKAISIVYILIFLSFCVGRFFIPAKMAILPHLLHDKEDVFMGNSLISTTAMIAAVLGFGIGGIIVEKYGLRTAFFIDALTFFVSAFFVLGIRLEKKGRFHASDILALGKDALTKVKTSVVFEVKEGLRYILKSEETVYAAKVFFLLFACIGSFYTVFIVFVQGIFSSITIDLGQMAVGCGLGLFLGALIYGRFGKRFAIRKAINFSLCLASAYLAFFIYFVHQFPSKPFALISCFLIGLLASPVVIAVNTLVHKESKDEFWGRIFASLEVVIHLAFLIFMFTASFLAERTSPFLVLISVAIITFSVSFIFLIKSND